MNNGTRAKEFWTATMALGHHLVMHFDIYSFSSLFVCISITAVVSFVFSVKHQMIQIEAALDTIGIRRDEFLELKGKVDLLVEQAKGCN